MIRPKRNDEPIQLTKQDLMKLLTEDDAMKHMLQKLLQEVLEAEMETALQAGKSERTGGRLGYRSGHYPRTLSPVTSKPATSGRIKTSHSERLIFMINGIRRTR